MTRAQVPAYLHRERVRREDEGTEEWEGAARALSRPLTRVAESVRLSFQDLLPCLSPSREEIPRSPGRAAANWTPPGASRATGLLQQDPCSTELRAAPAGA